MSVHTCHWPGCTRHVSPSMWGCAQHWRSLPPRIRHAIWAAYRDGQEVDKRPSPEYLAAAKLARDWIERRPHP